MTEVLGIVATLIILVSLCFPTMNIKSSLWLRSVSIIGNSLFLVYAIIISSISSSILSIGIILINVVHMVVLIAQHKKQTIKSKDL